MISLSIAPLVLDSERELALKLFADRTAIASAAKDQVDVGRAGERTRDQTGSKVRTEQTLAAGGGNGIMLGAGHSQRPSERRRLLGLCTPQRLQVSEVEAVTWV